MSFPLYDVLAKQCASRPALNPEQKKRLIDDIKKLDKDGADNLYLLIRYAARLEKDEKVFGAKYQRKGVIFNLEFFTDEMQNIINCFIETTKKCANDEAVEIVFD